MAEIDIAGPEYDQTDNLGATTTHPAQTVIIPTVFASYMGEASETYTQEDQSVGQLNSTIQIELSVLIYAVSYNTFGYNGFTSGDEIVHDPIFSIFIVSENPGVWAAILVVGGITLTGVAALLITKKKQNSVGFA